MHQEMRRKDRALITKEATLDILKSEEMGIWPLQTTTVTRMQSHSTMSITKTASTFTGP